MADKDDFAAADVVPEDLKGKRCKSIAEHVMRAFLKLAGEIAVDGRIAVKDLHRIAEAIQRADGPLPAAYREAEQQCGVAFHRASIEGMRRNHLGRLIAEPLTPWLDHPEGIERKRLGQLFLAVHMMTGDDEYYALRESVDTVANAHRGVDGIIDWPAFHADPEAKQILETVQVTIANSFKYADARRDWFLTVLNSTPAAVSSGSNAFTPLKPEERAKLAFTETHLANVFEAEFASVQRDTFYGDRERQFGKRWKTPPDKLFAPVFQEIAQMRMRTKKR